MRIAIDIDDVLSSTLPKVCEFHNKKYGTNLTINDFFCYDWEKIWGGTTKQATEKWFDFVSQSGDKLVPLKGSKDAVKELAKKHDLFVITARQNEFEKITGVWVNQNFGNYFKKILLTNGYPITGKTISKKDVCEAEQIDILIEDQLRHAVDCACENRKVILINYPWNQNKNLPKNIYRVDNWQEVTNLIKNNFE